MPLRAAILVLYENEVHPLTVTEAAEVAPPQSWHTPRRVQTLHQASQTMNWTKVWTQDIFWHSDAMALTLLLAVLLCWMWLGTPRG